MGSIRLAMASAAFGSLSPEVPAAGTTARTHESARSRAEAAGMLPGSHVRPFSRDTVRGTLRGTITDSLLSPLAEVEVLVNGLSVKVMKSTRTDTQGAFEVPRLPGNEFYRISFRKSGFQDLTQDIALQPGNRKVLTVVMAKVPSAGDSGSSEEGRISGRVVPFEAPAFYAALVSLVDSSRRVIRSVIAWDDGTYEIDRVPPGGPYLLLVSSMGFTEAVVESLFVRRGDRLTFNPMLAWSGSLRPSDRARGYRGWGWYWPKEILRRYPRESAADIYTSLTFRIQPRWEGKCPLGEKFFLNGQRVTDVPGAVLGKIDFKDVEEFRYIECYDETFPHLQRNSYWFRVKPSALPKEKKRA